jgi:C-8 sterol isomerase
VNSPNFYVALLRRGKVKGFRLVENCWLLEYGRGPVPTALPMGLSGAVQSLDGGVIWKTLRNKENQPFILYARRVPSYSGTP